MLKIIFEILYVMLKSVFYFLLYANRTAWYLLTLATTSVMWLVWFVFTFQNDFRPFAFSLICPDNIYYFWPWVLRGETNKDFAGTSKYRTQ